MQHDDEFVNIGRYYHDIRKAILRSMYCMNSHPGVCSLEVTGKLANVLNNGRLSNYFKMVTFVLVSKVDFLTTKGLIRNILQILEKELQDAFFVLS